MTLELLRKGAIDNHMCQEWIDRWQADTPTEVLLRGYVNNIGYSLKNNYPTYEQLLDTFDKEDLRKQGIFINDTLQIKDNQVIIDDKIYPILNKSIILQGESNGDLTFNDKDRVNLIIKDNSNVTINTSVHLRIGAYDKSRITINSSSERITYVYKYDLSDVTFNGNVKILDRA